MVHMSKTIEKPSTKMVFLAKTITIPLWSKFYHRSGLVEYQLVVQFFSLFDVLSFFCGILIDFSSSFVFAHSRHCSCFLCQIPIPIVQFEPISVTHSCKILSLSAEVPYMYIFRDRKLMLLIFFPEFARPPLSVENRKG